MYRYITNTHKNVIFWISSICFLASYEQIAVPVPRKFHDLVKPFFDRDLEVSVQVLPPPDEGFMIILKPKKSSKPS